MNPLDKTFLPEWDSPEIMEGLNKEVMNTSNHTEGPWQLTTVPFELRNTDSAASIYGPMSKDGGACLVADVSRSCGDQEASANARLIAAAPELLAALKETYEELRTAACGLTNSELGVSPALHERLTGLFKRAEAALAKAESLPI